MKKTSRYLALGVVMLVLALMSVANALADSNTGIPCVSDDDCSIFNNGGQYYCNLDYGSCFLVAEETAAEQSAENASSNITSVAETSGVTNIEVQVSSIQVSLSQIQNDLLNTKTNVASLSNELSSAKNKLSAMEMEVLTLKTELEELASANSKISSQTNSLASGLASLQKDIVTTQSSLDNLQTDLSKRQALTKTILIISFIVLAIGFAVGIGYYLTRRKKAEKKLSLEIFSYISGQIKKGSKFPQIKENLLKNGWAEEDIAWAYKETVKRNYQKFKGPAAATATEKKAKNLSAAPKFAQDPKKIIAVAVVSLLLIGGILFALRGASTGQAIAMKKLVGGQEGGYAGEVTYSVECTPPHILTPDKDACCLDQNNNLICDQLETRQAKGTSSGACSDNAECTSDKLCINGQCSRLSDIYGDEGICPKICEIYAVKISTSDGETYSLKPKTGSYTAVGAIEWKIQDSPFFCKGTRPIVPITIIKKNSRQILSEETITLQKRESSKVITHPDLPSVAFTLTLDDVFFSCPED